MLPALKYFATLPNPLVLQITGADAAKVVNNLSTNDLAKLSVDDAQESFITDARGWVVAHVGVLKQMERVCLLGSHTSPSTVASHIDRYIIREHAQVSDFSQEYALFIVGDGPDQLSRESSVDRAGGAKATSDSQRWESAMAIFEPPSPFTLVCPLPVFGQGSLLLGTPSRHASQAIEVLSAGGSECCTAERFEWLRISSFWPLYPADIGDKAIPQELDRDRQAISFTKGCYLGQETIARLDARGQLQKKLCLIELESAGEYAIGDTLHNEEKGVGHINSLARGPDGKTVRALATLRRGSFSDGTRLTCNGFAAEVLSR